MLAERLDASVNTVRRLVEAGAGHGVLMRP
jgi:hypothetical protein